MSLCDLNTQRDCFSKFTQDLTLTDFQTLLDAISNPAYSRTPLQRELLANCLSSITTVNDTFKDTLNFNNYLLQCSDFIEIKTFQKGSPIIMRGDKCDQVLIVTKGTINTYDLKTSKEVQKQNDEFRQTLNRIYNKNRIKNVNQPSSTTSLTLRGFSQTSIGRQGKRKLQKTVTKQSREEETSIDEGLSQNSLDLVVNKSVAPLKGFNTRRKTKIRTIIAFLRTKGGHVSKEFNDMHNYRCDELPHHEQILLGNEILKKKYFKEGCCIVNLIDTLSVGDIINERCLLSEYRSPITLVAKEDVQCITLSKQKFREVLEEEINDIENKKRFFLDFFYHANQAALLRVLPFIISIKYKMHEKIYNQGDKSKGVYFVKGGGEVKLYLDMYQKTTGSVDVPDSPQKELFLPNQQKALKKRKVIIGVVSKGDFFGEEDIVLGNTLRKYTALSGSSELILYHIPPKNYSAISEICPDVFKFLKQRAEQRNSWMENKIKNSEVIKDDAKTKEQIQKVQKYLNSSPNFHEYFTGQTSKQAETHRINTGDDSKTLSKVLLVKDHDIQQFMSDSFVPNHFLIAREKDLVEELKLSGEIKSVKRQTARAHTQQCERLNSNDKSHTNRLEIKNFEESSIVKPIELPPSYRLFEQERNLQKSFTPRKLVKPEKPATTKTMSGLKLDGSYLKGIQNITTKHANFRAWPEKERVDLPRSPITYRKGPQFGVKSYTKIPEKSRSPSRGTQRIMTESGTYHITLENAGVKDMRVTNMKNTLMTSLSNLHTTFETSKADLITSYRSTQTDAMAGKSWTDRKRSENILSSRPATHRVSTLNEKSRTDSASLTTIDIDSRKMSRPDLLGLTQISEFNDGRSSSNPARKPKVLLTKSIHNIFKPKLPQVSTMARSLKFEVTPN